MDILLLLDNPVLKAELLLNEDRSYQCHEINSSRKLHGEYHTLMPILKKYDDKFFNYLRMSKNTFHYILSAILPYFQKNWCNFHKNPIGLEERLVVTLRFLATGLSYKDLGFAFRMGESTVDGIIKEIIPMIWKSLNKKHMPLPSKEDFKKISDEYLELWNIPHCIGSIDCKHIDIKCPANSGSLFFNYKHFFSVVLQAVVDARCKFIFIDVGGYGQQSDGGTLQASSFYKCLLEGKISIPLEEKLSDADITLPYFFIGDAAYSLSQHFIKPYPGENLPLDKEIFNERLSRARKCVECAFGILTQKWRVLFKTMCQEYEFVIEIIKCICLLHNIIIDLENSENCEQCVRSNVNECDEAPSSIVLNAGYGKKVRDKLKEYFNTHPITYN